MNISTLFLLLRNIPAAAELTEATTALMATPEFARFNAAAMAFSTAIDGHRASAATQIAANPMGGHYPMGGHPHGTDSGRMPPGV